jgi:transposase
MLSLEEEVEAHALHRQGWSISAIARHLGIDRKTVRTYLNGDRVAGTRVRSAPLLIEASVPYCRQHLAVDMTRTYGPQHCSTRSWNSGSPGPTRA